MLPEQETNVFDCKITIDYNKRYRKKNSFINYVALQ